MKPSDCIGWTVEDARLAWRKHYPDCEIRVCETAPPARPTPKPKSVKSKAKPAEALHIPPKPREISGAWRVLRCHWSAAATNRRLEIVAAREIVLETDSNSEAPCAQNA